MTTLEQSKPADEARDSVLRSGSVSSCNDLLHGNFKTVVADPPWTYTFETRKTEVAGTGWRGAPQNHYSTMKFDDIAAMPIGDIAAPDATLWLWVVNPMLAKGIELVTRWGFQYRSLLTWAKVTKDGNPAIGMGYWMRGSTEHLMLATRGKVQPKSKSQPTWFKAGVGEHSAKPDQSYAIIEKFSDGPYLELFARRKRDGWTTWGNETSGDLFAV